MKIRAKLLLGFILVAIIAGSIGIFGVVQLKKIDNADTQLYETVAKPLGYCVEIATYFQRIRVNFRDALLSENAIESKKYLDRIDELNALWEKEITLYEGTIIDDIDKKNYQNFVNAKKEYMSYLPAFKAAMAKGDTVACLTLMRGDMQKTNATLQTVIDDLVAYNIESGKKNV